MMRSVLLQADGRIRVVGHAGRVEDYQAMLNGYMEVFYTTLTTDPMNSVIGLCDEDGWRNQPIVNPFSLLITANHGTIAGPIVLVRAAPDGDFVSLTDSDMADIQAILNRVIIITQES